MALNCAEQHVRQRMQERFGRDRVLTIGRVANLTSAHNGRAPCHYCGPCHADASPGRISAASTLRCPRRARPPADAAAVQYREAPRVRQQQNRIAGVRIIDAQTKQERGYTARVVFLCASALESARILLNSGLANSSGQVGRNIMDHIKWAGRAGSSTVGLTAE